MGASVDSLGCVERLARIDTSTYAGNLALISAVRTSLQANGIAFSDCFDPQGSRGIIAGTIPDARGRTRGGIAFIGQYGVNTGVLPARACAETIPRLRNGFLYGRGPIGIKAFLGLILGLLPVMKSTKLSWPIHLVVHFEHSVRSDSISHSFASFMEHHASLISICGACTGLKMIPRSSHCVEEGVELSEFVHAALQRHPIHSGSEATANAPCIAFWGPGGPAVAEDADDCVELTQLAQCSAQLKGLISSMTSTIDNQVAPDVPIT